ncbi:MAG: GNAT family N-acetyltransferase [Lachnospiraceae bacterium]|nr:GNAT family N-acetyltransferase [Lachnospiraceae bacterium]
MKIRRAEKRDIGRLIELLRDVLEVHAAIRPDIFVTGTTKYSASDLEAIIADDLKPVYVATDDGDEVTGYCFCQIQEQPKDACLVQFKTLYIDDLCVDPAVRGSDTAKALFEYAKAEAVRLGCYHVTLNVWTGNERAGRFYEKMGMKPLKTYMEYIL